MAKHDPMTFDRNRRQWRRYVSGHKPFVLSAKDCGIHPSVPSADAERMTRETMLEWWAANGPDAVPPVAVKVVSAVQGLTVAEIRRRLDEAEHLRRLLDAAEKIGTPDIAPILLPNGQVTVAMGDEYAGLSAIQSGKIGQAEVDAILGGRIHNDDDRDFKSNLFQDALQSTTKVEQGKTIKDVRERFLEVVGLRQAVTTRDQLKRATAKLSTMEDASGIIMPETADVVIIDSALVERMYLAIDRYPFKTTDAGGQLFGFFKRFVKWTASKSIIRLPDNLDSSEYWFERSTHEVKEYPIEYVRDVLAKLPERFRLYALLGLNCSMTQVDIGMMTHDMVKDGVLTRVRQKTGKRKRKSRNPEKQPPRVSYHLWPETLQLLNKHKSEHPERWLVSSDGTTLYEHEPKKDLISDRWAKSKDVPDKIDFKAFRSIGSTLAARHPEHKGHETYFLANVPTGNTARHYVPPSKEEFRQITEWMHDQIFPPKKKSKTTT